MSEDLILMPKSLTAENGSKYLFMGEFNVETSQACGNCDGSGYLMDPPDNEKEECESCCGSGKVREKHTIPWTTIKEIYAMAVKHLGK